MKWNQAATHTDGTDFGMKRTAMKAMAAVNAAARQASTPAEVDIVSDETMLDQFFQVVGYQSGISSQSVKASKVSLGPWTELCQT